MFGNKSFEKVRDKLQRMKYAVVGNSSAVQICRWTKNSLRGEGVCWKEKFYGVKSHRCCQMSPAVMWCENSCVHCWRPIEFNLGQKIPKNKVDEPKEILEGIVEARKKLLEGFGGSKKVSKKKLEESYEPQLYTMSLSGEPTIYPRLGELFKEIRRRGAVSFLVTNGLNSGALKKLKKENALPTQITVSTNAPNEKLFKKWHNSRKKNAWREFNKTLDVVRDLEGSVRRVIRLTLVDGGEEGKFKELTNMAEENVGEYSDLIRRARPDFVHVKGFRSVGYARRRGMGYDKQPWFRGVKAFAKKLEKELKKEGYKIKAKDERSCVVMLAKKGKKLKIGRV